MEIEKGAMHGYGESKQTFLSHFVPGLIYLLLFYSIGSGIASLAKETPTTPNVGPAVGLLTTLGFQQPLRANVGRG